MSKKHCNVFKNSSKVSRKQNSDLFSVSPKNVYFFAPYNHSQKRTLTILNPTDAKLLYKICTNAPGKYTAVPNCGSIEAYSFIELTVTLCSLDMSPRENLSHRISVLCIHAPKEQITQDEILGIFKLVSHSKIHNVRVPIQLTPKPTEALKSVLEIQLTKDVKQLMVNMRPLTKEYIKELSKASITKGGRFSCCRCSFLIIVFIVVVGMVIGKF